MLSAYAGLRIALLGDRDPRAEAAKLLLVRLAGNLDQVGLGNVRGGLHQLVRQHSIIREQQQAFAVEVETSDGVKASVAVHELHYRGPALGIRYSGYVSLGLVEGDILMTLGAF